MKKTNHRFCGFLLFLSLVAGITSSLHAKEQSNKQITTPISHQVISKNSSLTSNTHYVAEPVDNFGVPLHIEARAAQNAITVGNPVEISVVISISGDISGMEVSLTTEGPIQLQGSNNLKFPAA